MESHQTRKKELLKNFKRPTTIAEIQSFFGLASYYRRFIRDLADIAHPLVELTRKMKEKVSEKGKTMGLIKKDDGESTDTFNWGDEEQVPFETLRECLITPPIIIFPDYTKEFLIFTAIKYKITYKPGRDHGNADFLSRIRVVSAEERPDFMADIIAEQKTDELW